ncbi:multicomponent Na+:H+ antiporter subunit E [Dietzia kunjamensis]|uniref:Na+/H+ antiporter subunit E n=1 Tax=Dietzia kunjamensis TaxID=322509 RepID=UPI000E715875|nr:Na+/H+ antiporter subunit E [Dietzia kunjamensis]MBB1012962.1 Na+/H+ antiporter subunit E [Dietzia kunjamensis]RKE65389.1 multicomponent Na+:H+ antiporter subunit E [Dietzia kunjamensis]
MTVVLSAAGRFSGLLLVWWVVAGGDTAYWHYGLFAAALATALSLRLIPPTRPAGGRRGRPWEVPSLIAWFVWSALRGGTDVARRAFTPAMPIAPLVTRVPIGVRHPGGRRLALWMINLMPGSLVVDEGDGWADLHILSDDIDAETSWRKLDRRISRIVGD